MKHLFGAYLLFSVTYHAYGYEACLEIPTEKKCQEKIEDFCNFDNNSEAQKSKDTQQAFIDMEKRIIEKNAATLELEWGIPRVEGRLECQNGKTLEARLVCADFVERNMQAEIYIERYKGARKLLAESKADTLDYLNSVESKMNSKQDKAKIRIIKKNLKNAKLNIRYLLAGLDYNAFATFKTQNFQKKKFRKPIAVVQGMMLMLDQQPETLKMIMYHELAHLIGTIPFSLNENYQDHPFGKVFSCLRGRYSAEAAITDVACLEENFKKTPHYAEIAKINPNINLPQERESEVELKCQIGQVEEAWADWFAAEVINHKLTKENKLDEDGLKKSTAFFCQEYNLENAMLEKNFPGQSKNMISHGSHPTARTRVEKIIFARPEFRKIIGCSPLEPSPLYCKYK